MIYTSDIKKGLCIKYKNEIYKIIEFLHVKPGKGQAFVRTKLKSIRTGRVLEHTFQVGHKLEKVDVKSDSYRYLYEDENGIYFMNKLSYNQVYINKKFVNGAKFLKEGVEVIISFSQDDGLLLNVELPSSVVLKVTYTEQGLKGDTVTKATKPAILETGVTIQVPIFINIGEFIRVSTGNSSYLERIK